MVSQRDNWVFPSDVNQHKMHSLDMIYSEIISVLQRQWLNNLNTRFTYALYIADIIYNANLIFLVCSCSSCWDYMTIRQLSPRKDSQLDIMNSFVLLYSQRATRAEQPTCNCKKDSMTPCWREKKELRCGAGIISFYHDMVTKPPQLDCVPIKQLNHGSSIIFSPLLAVLTPPK